MKGHAAAGFGARLRALDIYRKTPKDLTEATTVGGAISVIASAVMLLLLMMELRDFVSVTTATSIKIDHSEDGVFQVNFNVTIQGLSCEFAAVDLKNVIGKKREDVKDKTIHKFSLDGTWQGFASKNDEAKHTYEGTNKDHYGNARHAIEMTADTFEGILDEYETLLVDFHAPWCSHCRNLAPVYEHAAEMVKQKAPHEIDTHHKHSAALATVDCTSQVNYNLCRANQIQAFPTILVYRQGKNRAADMANPHQAHESYHGERTADAISNFALQVLKEVIAGDPELEIGTGTDSTGDGRVDSKVRTRGCRVEGFLMVQRVPGQVIIRPSSNGHDLNTGLISMDHVINHLSFGQTQAGRPGLVHHQRLDRMDGAYAEHVGRPVVLSEGRDEVGFVGPNGEVPIIHEHYVKVVSKTFTPRRGKPQHSYEYTINSNQYGVSSETPVPEVVFTYDLSPLQVEEREVTKTWIDGLCSMCAILGGVFTCTVIAEGVLANALGAVAKKLA